MDLTHSCCVFSLISTIRKKPSLQHCTGFVQEMCNDFFFTKASIWSQIYCQTPLGGCRLFHSNPNLEQMHFYDWFLKRAAIYLCNLREKTLPSSLFPLSSFVKINMHCSTVLGRLLFMLAIHSMWLAVRNSSGQFQKAKFSLSLPASTGVTSHGTHQTSLPPLPACYFPE